LIFQIAVDDLLHVGDNAIEIQLMSWGRGH